MNTTKASDEINVGKVATDPQATEATTAKDSSAMKSALTVSQRLAICFVAGVLGAVGVVAFSYVLALFGPAVEGPVHFPVSLKSPGIYKPLFWGGLWGIPFGLLLKPAWNRLYLFGFLYVIAPMLAAFLYFMPAGGAGFFGLKAAGPTFPLYVLLVNLPFGIVTAWTAKAIIGKTP